MVHMRLARHVPSRYKVSVESRTFLHFCMAGKQAGMAMCMVHCSICREVFSLHGVHEVVFHHFDRMGTEWPVHLSSVYSHPDAKPLQLQTQTKSILILQVILKFF